MKIGLKAGERLFINGAVIRADKKTNIELMNDAVFLLEAHVLQPEEATTPLRQLYFILQTMIMDPAVGQRRPGHVPSGARIGEVGLFDTRNPGPPR